MTVRREPHGETETVPRSDDRDLISQAKRGEPRAIAALFDRLRCVPRMLSHRNRTYGSPLDTQELEDVAQEILIAVWRKLEQFDGRGPIEAWVHRFCVFQFAQALRDRGHAPRGGGWSDGELERVLPRPNEPSPFDLEALHLALDTLEADEAEVVRLKHFAEKSFLEIAHALGISQNTAKARYYRGLRRLQQRLAQTTSNRTSETAR